MRRRRHTRGLTLVEVVCALALLGIVSAAVVRTFGSSLTGDAASRERVRVVAAGNGWLERFRARTFDFEAFERGVEFERGYSYATDERFVVAGAPYPEVLDAEWGGFGYRVETERYLARPLVWRVTVEVRYRQPAGEEATYVLQTLIRQ